MEHKIFDVEMMETIFSEIAVILQRADEGKYNEYVPPCSSPEEFESTIRGTTNLIAHERDLGMSPYSTLVYLAAECVEYMIWIRNNEQTAGR